MKMQLAILTRSFDFSQRFFLSFLFIFFLSFFLFYLSFSLSLFSKRNGLSNRCMYRDDSHIGWQTDTGGIRPLASVYLWSDITTADRRACESDLPLEMAFDRRVVPRIDNQGLRDYCSHFPLDLFSPRFACPSTLSLFFFAFLLFRGIDRCVTHQLQTLRSFVQGNDGREEEFSSWYKFVERDSFFLISRNFVFDYRKLFCSFIFRRNA